jgi:hypothetical protein
MNKMNNRELQVALNKVCFSSDFKIFFTSKHHLCPSGMTISVVGEPDKEKKGFYLALVIREYGYDHSSNRGTSIYEDLQDFHSGSYDFTEEHLNTVLEYFKTRKPELFEKYMYGVTFYLDGI